MTPSCYVAYTGAPRQHVDVSTLVGCSADADAINKKPFWGEPRFEDWMDLVDKDDAGADMKADEVRKRGLARVTGAPAAPYPKVYVMYPGIKIHPFVPRH